MNQRILHRRLTGQVTEFALSVAVAALGLMLAMVFVVASGVSPSDGANAFIEGAFGSDLNLAGTLSKMVPLTLVALGWILVYRAGRFHVGFPGQILVGGLFVSVAALKLTLPSGLHLAVVVAAGALGGALYAAIAAWLWAQRGVNEILSTLLLNLVAIELLAWWVRGPFHDPATPLPLTRPLPESARWPTLMTDTSLHWDVLWIPVAIALVGLALSRTTWGFELRLVGANQRLAENSGVSVKWVGTQAIIASGALAGVAGSSLVLAGNTPAMGEDFGATYGFTGIAVALLARNSPVAVLPAALLFASLQQGGAVMEGTVGVSESLVEVIQGAMILLILAGTTVLYLLRRRRGTPAPVPEAAANVPAPAEVRS